jgi:hypothetical protein
MSKVMAQLFDWPLCQSFKFKNLISHSFEVSKPCKCDTLLTSSTNLNVFNLLQWTNLIGPSQKNHDAFNNSIFYQDGTMLIFPYIHQCIVQEQTSKLKRTPYNGIWDKYDGISKIQECKNKCGLSWDIYHIREQIMVLFQAIFWSQSTFSRNFILNFVHHHFWPRLL